METIGTITEYQYQISGVGLERDEAQVASARRGASIELVRG